MLILAMIPFSLLGYGPRMVSRGEVGDSCDSLRVDIHDTAQVLRAEIPETLTVNAIREIAGRFALALGLGTRDTFFLTYGASSADTTFFLETGDSILIWSNTPNPFRIGPSGAIQIATDGKVILGVNGFHINTDADSVYVTLGTIGGTSNQMLLSIKYPGGLYEINMGTGQPAFGNTEAFGTNRMSYYQWGGTNAGTLESVEVIVRVMLPGDFKSWDGDSAITFWYQCTDASADSNKVDFTVYEQSTEAADASSVNNVNTSWTKVRIDDSDLGDWNVAYEVGVIYLKLYSEDDDGTHNIARVGDIRLKYNR